MLAHLSAFLYDLMNVHGMQHIWKAAFEYTVGLQKVKVKP